MQRYSDNETNNHWLYLDDNHDPILFPCLFARYTQTKGYRIDAETTVDRHTRQSNKTLVESEIGSDASYKICNHLGRFLEWVDESVEIEQVKLSTHTALPDDIINEYINEYLIDECGKSEFVVNQAVNSINAYYDWLCYFFDNKKKVIGIKSCYREAARNNNKGALAVKYLLPQTRELLYRNAESLLEEIVLRNGGELGCRSKENQGFLLNDQKINRQTYPGLLTLFKELDSHPNKEEFEYRISSLYTKYGRARTLYIPQLLLEKMKRYYEIERPQTDSSHLLVSSSHNQSFGQCISVKYGSNTFKKIRTKLIEAMCKTPSLYRHHQQISESHVYHHLRHSYGTDFFYNLCEGQNKNYETITTTSSVYLMTAKRLGHKVDAKGANTVTATYIHSCGHREQLLREVVNG